MLIVTLQALLARIDQPRGMRLLLRIRVASPFVLRSTAEMRLR
jgi:hypothetical protein